MKIVVEPVGVEFICHWCREPVSESDTGDLGGTTNCGPIFVGARITMSVDERSPAKRLLSEEVKVWK